MKKAERYAKILEWFRSNRPVAETELHYDDPFQLLVAVILSAQCTDKRVNLVTPRLFQAFPTPEAMAAATPEAVYECISSVSYPNNKARHLVGMARMLLSDFGGQVPDTLEELVRLPGVGRKTANVVQSVVFHKAAMAVDTHVFRVKPSSGSRVGPLHHPPERRTRAGAQHSSGRHPHCPPLAHPARTLRLPGTYPLVRRVRPASLVQGLRACPQACVPPPGQPRSNFGRNICNPYNTRLPLSAYLCRVLLPYRADHCHVPVEGRHGKAFLVPTTPKRNG